MKDDKKQTGNVVLWAEAVRLLLAGGVGVIPTDTVYGLAARAQAPQAVAKLYALKSREHEPGTIIAANTEQLLTLGIERQQIEKATKWWPGSVSVILGAGQELKYLHQDLNSLAVRIPDDLDLRDFVAKTGPLVTSSANLPTLPESNSVGEALHYFGDAVDFYVDGGDLSGRQPSTILKIDELGEVTVIRQGAIQI